MSITSVRLQPEVKEGLEALANKQNRSKNWLINEALRCYIEHDSLQRARWQETLQALDSVSQGKVVSGEAVHAWLQSWGTDDEQSPPSIDHP